LLDRLHDRKYFFGEIRTVELLFASTPAPGHLEPILSLAHIALARGDEAICLTGAHLADSVRAAGVRFAPLPPAAGLDFRKMEEIYPEIVSMPPGPVRIRFSFERAFLDPMPAQAEALRELIEMENPDVVVTDSARIGAGVDAMVTEPIRHYLDQKLVDLGVPALNLSPWDAMVLTNDVYLHPSVPEFEYPFSPTPELVRFIGVLPSLPRGVLPSLPRKEVVHPEWWHEIEEGRPVVLVTQGTWANFDFSELVEPAWEAPGDRSGCLGARDHRVDARLRT
jgi:hypothetical protein